MTYHKTVFYNLEKTRGKWEITRGRKYGKISMISVAIDGPVKYCFNKQHGSVNRISFEANEGITAGKRKYKVEARDVTSTGIIIKTMVVRTIRATEMMDHG